MYRLSKYKRSRLYIREILFIILAVIQCSTGSLHAQKIKKAIFIIVDGIPADVIERSPTPALDAISKTGGYTRAYVGGEKGGHSQTPTISAVGYNSLLTGTWVNKHNVWDNDIAAPNYAYSTIFRFFENQYPQKKTAVFSTWLDNRAKLIGSEVKETGNLQPDIHFDGLELDTLTYPHDSLGKFLLNIDEAVTDTASAFIRRSPPDLSWIYLEFTDEMGHRYGNGKEMDDAVVLMDKQIRRIWDAIQFREKKFNEEWLLFITTDHGREENGYHHGGQTQRERTTWMVSNAKDLNARFKNEKPTIVDIMPTIARFLKINIPEDQKREIDGVPLTGPVSATELKAELKNKKLQIKWNVIDKKGKAKIWITTTNNFKTGSRDQYKLMGEVATSAGKTSIDLSAYPSDFYKLVLEFPYNDLNRWIMVNK